MTEIERIINKWYCENVVQFDPVKSYKASEVLAKAIEQYVIKEKIEEYQHQFLSKEATSETGIALQDFVFERIAELKKGLK